MKLGISLNFFNGEEHLVPSLKSVRGVADHINVIVQYTSNAGNEISTEAIKQLQDAINQGLVDKVIEYKPDFRKTRQKNEMDKRRLGLREVKLQRCTHFLGMDADEFYRPKELQWAMHEIEKHNYTVSTVGSFFHIKRPIYRSRDTTNVPFIAKVNFLTAIGKGNYPAQNVDPTRIIRNIRKHHREFEVSEVAMYHMNFVRSDFSSKFRNTSTTDSTFLETVEDRILKWSIGQDFDFPGKGKFRPQLVDNEFETFDPIPTQNLGF